MRFLILNHILLYYASIIPSISTASPPSFRHYQMEALFVNPSLSGLKLPPKLLPTTTSSPISLSFHRRLRPPHHPLNLSISASTSAVENQPQSESDPPQFSNYDEDETYGEVKSIIGSRALQNGAGMEYLIEWEDDHAPTWVPANLIAADVIAEYENPWWVAAKKADDLAPTIITSPSSTATALMIECPMSPLCSLAVVNGGG